MHVVTQHVVNYLLLFLSILHEQYYIIYDVVVVYFSTCTCT